MVEQRTPTGIEHRRDERMPLDEAVTVEFGIGTITGSGQNVSAQGVFFVADAPVPVTVRIGGREPGIAGELVRYENMGNGRVGIAVRFLEPQAPIAD